MVRGWASEPPRAWSPGREKPGAAEPRHRGRSILQRHEGSELGDETVKASLCEPVISQSAGARSAVWLELGRGGVCHVVPGTPGSPEEGPPNRVSFCSTGDALATASRKETGLYGCFPDKPRWSTDLPGWEPAVAATNGAPLGTRSGEMSRGRCGRGSCLGRARGKPACR